MQVLLAVDAGGTKCEALAFSAAGDLLGWGLCRADDPAAGTSWGGRGRSKQSALTAIRRALGELHPPALTVSGLGRWDVPELVSQFTAGDVEAIPVAEWDAPLALANVDWGIVVLAGTGAFVHGRLPDGTHLHLDSLGPFLGDYGSGSMIGNLAMRAVARHHWAPRHQTTLTRDVAEVLGIDVLKDGVGKLVGFAHERHDRAVVAMLAERVDRAAEAGDAVARGILEDAAAQQAEVVRDVVGELGLGQEPTPFVAAGSVATKSRLYWQALCARAREFAPHITPVVPAGPQVLGTALRALRRVGEPGADERLRSGLAAATAVGAD